MYATDVRIAGIASQPHGSAVLLLGRRDAERIAGECKARYASCPAFSIWRCRQARMSYAASAAVLA